MVGRGIERGGEVGVGRLAQCGARRAGRSRHEHLDAAEEEGQRHLQGPDSHYGVVAACQLAPGHGELVRGQGRPQRLDLMAKSTAGGAGDGPQQRGGRDRRGTGGARGVGGVKWIR